VTVPSIAPLFGFAAHGRRRASVPMLRFSASVRD
jgi:hypothetical protein